MKYLPYFFLIICFLGSAAWLPIPRSSKELKPAEKLVNKILEKAGTKIEKKYGIRCIGEGASMPSCVVQTINLGFQAFLPPLTREEARKLLINCAHDFLEDINSYPELAEYAPKFPFDGENIELTIYCYKPDGYDVYHPYVRVADFNRGKLVYYTNTEEDTMSTYHEIYKETYEEALEILKNNPQ